MRAEFFNSLCISTSIAPPPVGGGDLPAGGSLQPVDSVVCQARSASSILVSWTYSGNPLGAIIWESLDGAIYSPVARVFYPQNTFLRTGLNINESRYYSVQAYNNSDTSPPVQPVVVTSRNNVTKVNSLMTQEEINLWIARVNASGPFVSLSDYKTNSPGDWNMILDGVNGDDGKNDFDANPSGDRYTGLDEFLPGPIPEGPQYIPNQPGERHIGMICAAFYAAYDNDNTLAQKIVTELKWHAGRASLDFTNNTMWANAGEQNPFFNIANWCTRLVRCYMMIKGFVSSGDRTIIEDWLTDMGTLWASVLQELHESHFSDNDIYGDNISSQFTGTNNLDTTHWDGYEIRGVHKIWNNRKNEAAELVMHLGVALDNDVWVEAGKQFYKNWIKFGLFPDGTPGEFHRWTEDDNGHEQGLAYAQALIFDCVKAADLLARHGDDDLFNYATDAGLFEAAGGNKSLFKAIEAMSKYSHDGWTPRRYCTNNASLVGAERRWVNMNRFGNGDILPAYGCIPKANMYYNSKYFKDVYTTEITNSIGYNPPSNDDQNHDRYYRDGTWFSFFPHALLEDQVWPFNVQPKCRLVDYKISGPTLFVTFSEGIWRNQAANLPVDASCFRILYKRNGGNLISVSIASVTDFDGDIPQGGECTFRIGLNFQGSPSGPESMEFCVNYKRAFDRLGDYISSVYTTGELSLI